MLIGIDYTDVNGYYLFEDLYPGNYYVQFEYDGNVWERTLVNVGGNDNIDSDVGDFNGANTTETIGLPAGVDDLRWDLGLYHCIPIGDFVWFDIDADGIQDPWENGLNGVRVYLYDIDGNLVDQAITSANPNSASADGYFKFCAPPGTYYLGL